MNRFRFHIAIAAFLSLPLIAGGQTSATARQDRALEHGGPELTLAESSADPHAASRASELSIRVGGDWLSSVGHRSMFTQPDLGSGTVELMLRSDGSNGFSRAFNRPSFGVGFSFLDQSSTQLKNTELGDVYALYGTVPLQHWKPSVLWRQHQSPAFQG